MAYFKLIFQFSFFLWEVEPSFAVLQVFCGLQVHSFSVQNDSTARTVEALCEQNLSVKTGSQFLRDFVGQVFQFQSKAGECEKIC